MLLPHKLRLTVEIPNVETTSEEKLRWQRASTERTKNRVKMFLAVVYFPLITPEKRCSKSSKDVEEPPLH